MHTETNPPISVVLRAVTWLEVAILAWAGGGLLFYPPIIAPFWPWPLAPFNLRYLGALFVVGAAMVVRSGDNRNR